MTTVFDHLVYDAFGRVTSESNPSRRHKPAVGRHGGIVYLFSVSPPAHVGGSEASAARPFDPDTGLQNNLNRWYDPAVGRWLSEDPIGFAGGDGNLYRYVRNRPMWRIDASGFGLFGVNVSQPCKIGSVRRNILLQFDCCTEEERDKLGKKLCSAARAAYQVFEAVDLLVRIGITNQPVLPEHEAMIDRVRACLDRWFGETTQKPGTVINYVGAISKETLVALRRTLFKIAFAFLDQFGILAPKRIGVQCHSKDSGNCRGNKAYTYGRPGRLDISDVIGTDIHICPGYWRESDPLRQIAILLHEISHEYGGTRDIAYLAVPGNVGSPYAPLYDIPSNRITVAEALVNGPTYEEFFRCYLMQLGS